MALLRTVNICLAILSPASRVFPGILRNTVFIPNDFERNFAFLEKISNEFKLPDYGKVRYDDPESYGFQGAGNRHLVTPDGVKLGVWHLLPYSVQGATKGMSRGVKAFKSLVWLLDAKVFLYFHGSVGTRAHFSRRKTYKLLTDMNFHVIAFDYRGYGDSTSRPRGERDFVMDSMTVYNWLQRYTKNIYFWGHSLGTGIAAHTAHKVVNRGYGLKGIVLEAAFNTMADAVRFHPLTQGFKNVPWFEFSVIRPLAKYDMNFNSEFHLKVIPTPILLLHAKDDDIVPYQLGVKLFLAVRSSRKDQESVKMVLYKEARKYGHNRITLDPYLDKVIGKFIERTKQGRGQELKYVRVYN